MKRSQVAWRAALGLLCLASAAGAASAETLYVTCGHLLTSAAEPMRGPSAIVVTDGVITAVGDANLPAPEGARRLDLSAYTVTPGFIDSHIHLWTGPQNGPPPSYALQALRAQKSMFYALGLGIVGVRVLGTDGFIDVALRDAVNEGAVAGPHILPAAHAISIPGGHTDHFTYPATTELEGAYTPLQGFINSPSDAEKAVHLQIKYGAQVIKMMASGGVGSPLDSPEAEQISPEEMKVVVQQAHMDHLKVAAHDENLQTILDALHAGVDSLEHASELDAEAIGWMKAHGTWWDPTLFVVDNIVQGGDKGPAYRIRKGKILAGKHFASFALGLKGGLAPQMLAGSDMPYEPGGGTVLDEMVTLVKYGASPRQALLAATKNGATVAGWTNLGTLEVGKEGDLVALEGDPTSDISAVKRTRAVVFQGKVVLAPGR